MSRLLTNAERGEFFIFSIRSLHEQLHVCLYRSLPRLWKRLDQRYDSSFESTHVRAELCVCQFFVRELFLEVHLSPLHDVWPITVKAGPVVDMDQSQTNSWKVAVSGCDATMPSITLPLDRAPAVKSAPSAIGQSA